MGLIARAAFIASLGLVLAAQACLAQTPAQTASRWSLLGGWRTDCRAPLSKTVSELAYVVKGGQLFLDRDWGEGTDSSAVRSARVQPDGSIDVEIVFASLSQTRLNAFIKGTDGRIRTTISKNVDTNDYSIRDGKFVDSGSPTSWLTRCRSLVGS
jgi:hypothetical protein